MQCTGRTRVCGAGLVIVAGRSVAFAPTSTSSHRHSRWEDRGRRWFSHACKQRFNFLLLTSLQGLDLHHMSERRQFKKNVHTDYDILMRHLGNITTVTDNKKKKKMWIRGLLVSETVNFFTQSSVFSSRVLIVVTAVVGICMMRITHGGRSILGDWTRWLSGVSCRSHWEEKKNTRVALSC